LLAFHVGLNAVPVSIKVWFTGYAKIQEIGYTWTQRVVLILMHEDIAPAAHNIQFLVTR
jgi:hypothetical protein